MANALLLQAHGTFYYKPDYSYDLTGINFYLCHSRRKMESSAKIPRQLRGITRVNACETADGNRVSFYRARDLRFVPMVLLRR